MSTHTDNFCRLENQMLITTHQKTGCGLHRLRGRLETKDRTGERGATALEFTLIAVLLFTLVFGIIDFGRALYTYHWTSYAAHQATRWASVRGSQCSGLASGCPAAQNDIVNYVKSIAIGVDPTKISINSNPWSIDGNNKPGSRVQVTVTYTFTFLLPFMPSNSGTLSTITMSSTSQMVISQ
jgi:Flp pilus assembly protein TadG